MITLEGVTVKKNGRVILADISATLGERRIGIIGANGSGKSTFAKLLNGLETDFTGIVSVHGIPVRGGGVRSKVGFVFQNPDNQIVFPLVGEDLRFGLKKSGLSKAQISERIDHYLLRFGLSDFLNRRTHELSGGEKQLIALIGVLVMEPDIIVLDEPTTLLDLRNRTLFVSTLSQLEQKLIIVSHDLDLMAKMERVIWFAQGRIAGDGPAADVIAAYRKFSEGQSC